MDIQRTKTHASLWFHQQSRLAHLSADRRQSNGPERRQAWYAYDSQLWFMQNVARITNDCSNQPTSQISKISTFLRLRWFLIMIPSPNMPLHWNPGHLGVRMVPSPPVWQSPGCPRRALRCVLGLRCCPFCWKYPDTPAWNPIQRRGIEIICFA